MNPISMEVLCSAALIGPRAAPILAYLDPGAGSYLLQLLMAGFLGLMFSVKVYWKSLSGMWSRRLRKTEQDNFSGD